jgi:hypothetical protein
MKKSILLLILLASTTVLFAQGLVNPSFETWTPFVTAGGTGEYPTGWTTTDSITKANGNVESVWKGTDAYEGAHSIHLKTVQVTIAPIPIPIKGPGVATNGKINLVGSAFVFSGGSADTSRARYYSGQYKYTPGGAGDSAQVSVYLLKTVGTLDTVAVGNISLDEATTYRQFLVMMNFRNFNIQPDTCLIIMQSSKGSLNGTTVVAGSELVVDSLAATGFVGVEELNGDVKSFSVYPSPASSFITLDADLRNATALSYDLFDNNGRWIRSEKMNTSKETIEISDLAVGNYIVKLNADGKLVTAKQFSVNR